MFLVSLIGKEQLSNLAHLLQFARCFLLLVQYRKENQAGRGNPVQSISEFTY